jgi:hypothetical protein
MNPEVPNVSRNGRYDIARTAQELGIHRNTLRLIDPAFLPKRYHTNGRPFYYGKDILYYWFHNVR